MTYACVTIPDEDPTEVTSTLPCTMKFLVKDCDPNTGEADDEGYDDEYVVREFITSVKKELVKLSTRVP